MKRNEELATAPSDKLKALRNEGNEAYYKLRSRLNSNLDISDGAEAWAATIDLLNQSINNYMALLACRTPLPGNGQPELPLG